LSAASAITKTTFKVKKNFRMSRTGLHANFKQHNLLWNSVRMGDTAGDTDVS